MEYGPASSNSVNIISADSSVISSLDEDEEGPTTAKPPNKKAKDETSQSIKREINVNKSIYIGGGGSNNNSSNNKSNQGESVQSNFFQGGPVAAAPGKSTPPIFGGRSNAQQFKNAAKMNNVPASEYLNNYYINRQEFGGGSGKGENFNEFQKLVVRPQYAMQFGEQQKPEGKFNFFLQKKN